VKFSVQYASFQCTKISNLVLRGITISGVATSLKTKGNNYNLLLN